MDKNSSILNKLTTDAVLLAVISALSYSLTYAYEFGTFLVYKIPAAFIAIDLNKVLLSMSVTILLVFGTWIFYLKSWDSSSESRKKTNNNTIILLGVSLVAFFTFMYSGNSWIGAVFMLLLVVASMRTSGLLFWYYDSRRALKTESDLNPYTGINTKKLGYFGGSIVLLLLHIILLLLAQVHASAKTAYMTLPGDRVILVVQEEHYIVGVLNSSTNQLSQEFEILKRDDEPFLSYKEIGPITSFHFLKSFSKKDAEAP